MKMKKTLLATVAVAAVVGFSTLATAQNADQGKDATKAPAPAAQGQKPTPGSGGAMMKPQAQGTQGAQSTKPDEHVGQDQQKETTPPQKGAQEERSTPTKGAQDENSKSGVNANQKNANGSKGSVQLSQDQRTKIHGIIGHDSSARVTTNVNFNITVGTRVPSSVHVEVLPEDVVEIVPQYQSFEYVIVGDNILIIDPNTMEIVDIIPV
jgi:type IV secretory pathway VirB10-like protein